MSFAPSRALAHTVGAALLLVLIACVSLAGARMFDTTSWIAIAIAAAVLGGVLATVVALSVALRGPWRAVGALFALLSPGGAAIIVAAIALGRVSLTYADTAATAAIELFGGLLVCALIVEARGGGRSVRLWLHASLALVLLLAGLALGLLWADAVPGVAIRGLLALLVAAAACSGLTVHAAAAERRARARRPERAR